MKQRTIFTYNDFRYLKLSAGLVTLSVLAYFWHQPDIKPNGGTWLGYVLGTVGALLILLLLAYGLRKRSYQSSLGRVQGWLSAHVFLGSSLIVVATLHTGFEFGLNVHTLAYLLMLGVIFSGFWGTYFYIRNPTRMSAALRGETLEQHLLAIEEIDNECRALAMNHVDHINRALMNSINAPLFENFWQQFTGRNPRCKTTEVATLLSTMDPGFSDAQARINAELYRLQLQKQSRLARLRHYTRQKSWLDAWLMLHVPLSVALLAALIAHIVSVFFYW